MMLLVFYNNLTYLLRLYPDMSYVSDNDLVVHTVDVGQGLCVMMRFPNGDTMVYDTGVEEEWSSVNTYIDNVLSPDDNTLDYLILSHTDTDHTGSAANILTKYDPRYAYVPDISQTDDINDAYLSFYDSLLQSDTEVKINVAGLKLVVAGVSVTWLAPSRDYYQTSNDYSAVLLVEYGRFQILLTADAGHNTGIDDRVNTENEFVSFAESSGIDLDVDVLYAGHHGSKYSTSQELLELTTPESLIVSVGDNSYGHPSQEMYNNVQEYDSNNNTELFDNIIITKESGNIVIAADANGDYSVGYISDIHDYTFINLIWVIIILMLPVIYYLLDSIMIYRSVIAFTKKK